MAQASEKYSDYMMVSYRKMRKFLKKNPIDAYFDMDDNPMGFELLEPVLGIVLEVDADKASSIARQIMFECKAQGTPVRQWLSDDRLKTWRCRVRKTVLKEETDYPFAEEIEMTMIGENGRKHTIRQCVLRGQNYDEHDFYESFAGK